MPKELALGQRVRDGGAVQGDERLTAATAEIVDRLRHDLLARAVLAVDEHGQIGLRHAANDRPQRLDCRAFADQPHAFGRLLGDLAVGGHQLLAVLGVFQGHRRVGGQFDQGLLIFLREGAGELVDQFEHAESLARPRLQGNTRAACACDNAVCVSTL